MGTSAPACDFSPRCLNVCRKKADRCYLKPLMEGKQCTMATAMENRKDSHARAVDLEHLSPSFREAELLGFSQKHNN
ncbi:hypothetical protein HPP92_022085 [Vanilla planifolia]|uniref:Uncharacterized protein n=1 Tax=Vanilla planifolia TaxID=51239 RepID=A0A835PQ88_VANPL|nr:hypothetical protein HPP92_022085 [Vanilla planifolia]